MKNLIKKLEEQVTFLQNEISQMSNELYSQQKEIIILKKEIFKNNILIAIDDTNKLNKKLKNNSKLYLFKSIKYNNYGSKFINVYLPNKCKTLP